MRSTLVLYLKKYCQALSLNQHHFFGGSSLSGYHANEVNPGRYRDAPVILAIPLHPLAHIFYLTMSLNDAEAV
jgi:hypothetical protein